MMHGVKKIKVRQGKDANQMLVKKLLVNFLESSHLVTTEKKAKIVKTVMDKLVTKAKTKTEANKNVLLKYFPQEKYVTAMTEQVAGFFKDRTGGYVRVVKLNQRATDAAMMCHVEWVEPVTIEWNSKKAEKTAKAETKKAKKVKVQEESNS